jgi:serine/threonine-protein kinase HipA
MATKKTDIFVYADWIDLPQPTLIGILSAQQAKGRKAFGFTYDHAWIKSDAQRLLDPDIQWFPGTQHPNSKENFGVFMDSMPDTWGRTLMKRRAAQQATEIGNPPPTLYDIDFLLGVYDETRMGALRFKLHPDGPFLDDNANFPTPPWSNIRELQHAADVVESDATSAEIKKYLAILIAPGSSLGGARPKANVRDEEGNFWIAKFPSRTDTIDKAAWEYLAYKLAVNAGISMPECQLKKIAGHHHTFFTKRFDRIGKQRIHFASAMTMTGNSEETTRDNPGSYLDIALFIQTYGSDIVRDLHQLWRRIIFNIAVSNTDDHFRNHGFILGKEGWTLSPAYDINPSTDKNGLQLNIDETNNALDFNLAKSVGFYFQLNDSEMDKIISEVLGSVKTWKDFATQIGIPRSQVELMSPAFNQSVTGDSK